MGTAATTVAAQTPGLLNWITQYGNYVAFFAQLIYWLALIVLLAYAVAQFKRWVNYQLGTGRSGALRTDLPARSDEDAAAVSVEEFVE